MGGGGDFENLNTQGLALGPSEERGGGGERLREGKKRQRDKHTQGREATRADFFCFV